MAHAIRTRRFVGRGKRTAVPVAVAALAIVASAAALRISGLHRRSLWRDEVNVARLSDLPPRRLVRALARDTLPPLYYLVLKSWRATAGGGDASMRRLSCLLGVLLVVSVLAVGVRMTSRAGAMVAGALAAVAPRAVWYSQDVRYYSFVAIASVWMVYFAFRLRSRSSAREAGGYVAAAVVVLYAHNYGLLLLGAVNIAMLPWVVRSARNRRRWLLAQAGVILCYLPWMPVLFQQMGEGKSCGIEPLTVTAFARGVADCFIGFRHHRLVTVSGTLTGLCLTAMGVQVLAGRSGRRGSRASAGWMLLAPAIGVTAAAMAASAAAGPLYHMGRHDFLVQPLWWLFAGWTSTRCRRRRSCMAVLGVFALCLLSGLRHYRTSFRPAPDFQAVSRYVKSIASEEDLIVVLPDYYLSPFLYYYRGSGRVLGAPSMNDEPLIDWRDWDRRWQAAQLGVRLREAVLLAAPAGSQVVLVHAGGDRATALRNRIAEVAVLSTTRGFDSPEGLAVTTFRRIPTPGRRADGPATRAR